MMPNSAEQHRLVELFNSAQYAASVRDHRRIPFREMLNWKSVIFDSKHIKTNDDLFWYCCSTTPHNSIRALLLTTSYRFIYISAPSSRLKDVDCLAWAEDPLETKSFSERVIVRLEKGCLDSVSFDRAVRKSTQQLLLCEPEQRQIALYVMALQKLNEILIEDPDIILLGETK